MSFRRPSRIGLFALAVVLATNLVAVAGESPIGKVVADVIPLGNRIHPKDHILAQMQTRPGKPYDEGVIQEDVRRLIGTRWFAPKIDVETKVETDGRVTVYLHVLELNSIVQDVVFVGNQHIRKDTLLTLTGVRKGSPLNPAFNEAAAQIIQNKLREDGRYFATVSVREGTKLSDSRVVFEIVEGPVVKISGVSFKGCNQTSSGRLATQLSMSAPLGGTFRVLNSKYNPMMVAEDRRKLIDYMHKLGHLEARVQEEIVPSADLSSAEVVFHVDEGPVYQVREVRLERGRLGAEETAGGLRLFSEERVRPYIELKPGGRYDKDRITADCKTIEAFYGYRGYRVAVDDQWVAVVGQPGFVDVVYTVYEPGPRNNLKAAAGQMPDAAPRRAAPPPDRVGRIVIEGNTITHQDVILNELARVGIREGQILQHPSLKTAELNLLRRGLFDPDTPPSVQVRNSANGSLVKDVVVTVKETRTGQVQFGVGINSNVPRQQAAPPQPDPTKTRGQAPDDRPKRSAYRGQFPDDLPPTGRPAPPPPPRDFTRTPDRVGRIIIEGNTVTHQDVILNELSQAGIRQGQILQYPSLQIAELNLLRRGIFDPEVKPTVIARDGGFDNEFKDIVVTVQETRTGQLLFGAGINSNSGVTGNIALNERNFDILRVPTSVDDLVNGRAFRGRGQEFRLEAQPGTIFQRYSVTFREPYLRNSNYGLTASGYYFNRGYVEYDEDRYGGRFSLDRRLDPIWRAGGTLRVEGVNVKNVPIDAPRSITDFAGTSTLVGLRGGLTRDTRDSFLFPTTGSILDVGYEQVLGTFSYPIGTAEFTKFFSSEYFQRKDGSGKHVIAVRSQVAVTSQDAPVYEKFFAGGFRSIRGFSFRGMGPVELGTFPNSGNYHTGGSFSFLNTLEYQIPLNAKDSLFFVTFIDHGTVERTVTIKDYRVSAGFGFRVSIPALGPVPVAFDFAFPINKTPGDNRQVFAFYVGLFGGQ